MVADHRPGRDEVHIARSFGASHPAVAFGFFVCAIVLSVIVQNPVWLGACVICAAAYYLCVRGLSGWKVVCGMIPVFIVLSAINPLFNTLGNTVLFTYFGGRPYTLEALFYGMQTAGMFVSILLWFGSYNRVMSSDKFTYLFGGLAPSITLVLTMILRLVPSYMRKAAQISSTRACIGLVAREGGVRKRAHDGIAVLSALTTWALESSVITADSMRSRGYGSGGRRTQFASYTFRLRDVLLTAVMVALLAVAVVSIANGCAGAEFIPTVIFPPVSAFAVAGFAAFALFLAMPSIVDIQERISWRNSISRI